MKVSNRKCVRHLAWKSLLASRTRNLIAIVAIALTTMLFTSLFTIALSINEGFQQSNFRQVGGFSHGGFKYMTQAQFNELKDDPLISQWGERRYLGMPTEEPFNKSHVEVSFADANEAHWMFCDPVEGSLPQEAPTRQLPTLMYWNYWVSSRRLGPSLPSLLTWMGMKPLKPSPSAAGGNMMRPS